MFYPDETEPVYCVVHEELRHIEENQYACKKCGLGIKIVK